MLVSKAINKYGVPAMQFLDCVCAQKQRIFAGSNYLVYTMLSQ